MMKFNRDKFYSHFRRAFGKLSAGQVEGLNFILALSESDKGWSDVRHLAYFLATIKHETADTYEPIKEYRARAGSKGRANQDRYWLTGYMGRGYVQITWKKNYQAAGDKLGIDLAGAPDMAMSRPFAYQIAARGMREGWFTGKKLSNYIHGDRCDYINARRIINGTDKAELIARYASTFETILRVAADAGEVGAATEGAGSSPDSPDGTVSPSPQTSTLPDGAQEGEAAPQDTATKGEAVAGGRPSDPIVTVPSSLDKVKDFGKEAVPYLQSGLGTTGKASIAAKVLAIGAAIWSGITSPVGLIFCGLAAGVLLFWLYTRLSATKQDMKITDADKQREHEMKMKLIELDIANANRLADPAKYNVVVRPNVEIK